MSDFQQTVDLRGKSAGAPKPPKKSGEGSPAASLDKIYSAEADGKKEMHKINQPAVRNNPSDFKLIRLAVFILAFLIVGFTVYSLFFKSQTGTQIAVKSQNWYAVKLVDGEIFYGQIKDTKTDPIVIANVYYNYDQVKTKDGQKTGDQAGSLKLVKRGQETHGPDGTMDIVRSQVLFMEPLKADSKVLKAILEY